MFSDNGLDILDPRVALLLTVGPENVPLLPPKNDETKQLVPAVIRQYLSQFRRRLNVTDSLVQRETFRFGVVGGAV
jgi:hypothetical protein